MVLQDQEPEDVRQITLRQLAVIVAVAAVLSVAREVFIPLAIATLITFALAPAVTALRKRGLPRVAAVVGVVLVAFVLIGLFFLMVAGQVAELAQSLPKFQAYFLAKLTALQEVGGKSGIGVQLANLFSAINTQISAVLSSGEPASATAPM